MPLFCTLKATYTGTNVPPIEKFSNNGYPLLFEPVNKHLFYANPDDNTVNKFYCAPLSKELARTTTGETIDVSVGGSFDVQDSTSVSDHVIMDNKKTVKINKETSVTSTGSLSANQSLTWGSTVNIPISIKNEGTNGHELSLRTGKLTMPANPNTDNHKATHNFIIKELSNHSSEVKVEEIVLTNTGSNSDGSANNARFLIESGNNVNITKSNDNQIKISADDTHAATHGGSIDTITGGSAILQLTNNGSDGTKTTNLWTLQGAGVTTISAFRNNVVISSIDSHVATHGASIDTATANSPILQLTKNGSSGNDITNLWTLKGSGSTTVSASSNTVTISSTDASVRTVSTPNKVYLSGKTTSNNSTGNEYVNSSVYMNNGSLYSKHFYATTPNTGNWGTSVAAALDIKGNDSGSQTPIFRVTSNTYGNCQLEYCEKFGVMRLYRNGKYTEFPNWNIDGKIPISTTHNQNAVNTLVHDIRVVSALPSNAASYPNTLFLVTG